LELKYNLTLMFKYKPLINIKFLEKCNLIITFKYKLYINVKFLTRM